jgi:nucleotide-binding universal stress UspA family protein
MSLLSDRTKETERPFTIVVGLDFTDAGGLAFDQAARLACRVPKAELHLVHAFPTERDARKTPRDIVEHLEIYAAEKAAAFGGLPGTPIGVHVRTGDVAREIVQLASDVGADLILLGSRKGIHLPGWVASSASAKVMASAPCAVLVAGPRPAPLEKHEPAIEPPCAECVSARFTTHGHVWWCERHAAHHDRPHTYSDIRELPFASHDGAVSLTGTG